MPVPNQNRSRKDRVMAKKPIRQIRTEGNFAYIPLTQGYEAIIDAIDVGLADQFNWYAYVGRTTVYALRRDHLPDGTRPHVRLHSVIMKVPCGFQVDHIDLNGLNNTRSNLRKATPSQQVWNQGLRVSNNSGFKGVCWDKRRMKWRAVIKINRKQVYLGQHDHAEDAHAAYVEASKRLHGDFGRTE